MANFSILTAMRSSHGRLLLVENRFFGRHSFKCRPTGKFGKEISCCTKYTHGINLTPTGAL